MPSGHAARAHAREPTTGATRKTATETVPEAVSKATVEMIETLYHDDRRCETKKPGRPAPAPTPVRRKIGIGIGFRVGIGGGVRRILRCRDFVDLRRQSG